MRVFGVGSERETSFFSSPSVTEYADVVSLVVEDFPTNSRSRVRTRSRRWRMRSGAFPFAQHLVDHQLRVTARGSLRAVMGSALNSCSRLTTASSAAANVSYSASLLVTPSPNCNWTIC